MANVQIKYVSKDKEDHESITYLGDWYEGKARKWSKAQLVKWISDKEHTFYTEVDGKHADIGVVSGSTGDYLRTYADGYYNDNLLALPDFPIAKRA